MYKEYAGESKIGTGAMTAAKNKVFIVITWKFLFSGGDKNLVKMGGWENFWLVGQRFPLGHES